MELHLHQQNKQDHLMVVERMEKYTSCYGATGMVSLENKEGSRELPINYTSKALSQSSSQTKSIHYCTPAFNRNRNDMNKLETNDPFHQGEEKIGFLQENSLKNGSMDKCIQSLALPGERRHVYKSNEPEHLAQSSFHSAANQEKHCIEYRDVRLDTDLYVCGACLQKFVTICQLHEHVKVHGSGGSYYFDHQIKTAFPRFDTVCKYIQTDDERINSCTSKRRSAMNHEKSRKRTKQKSNEDFEDIKTEIKDVAIVKNSGEIQEMDVNEDDNEKLMGEFNEKDEVKDYNIKDGVSNESDNAVDDNVKDEDYIETVSHKSDSDTDDYTFGTEKNSKKRRKRVSRAGKKNQPRSSSKANRTSAKTLNIKRRTKPADRVLVCKVCDSKFKRQLELRRHVRSEHKDIPFVCMVCSERFQCDDDMKEHQKSQHSSVIHQCELCNKVLSTRLMLEGHYLVHKGIKPFSCDICVPKREFTRKSQLTAHMQTHSEEKTLQCEFCGKPFNARYLMINHVKHCGGIKPHKCDFCSMAFVSNHCLQRHRRTHTGEKPFVCEVCAFASGNASCLARHMRVHTGEKPFVCSYCNQAFAAPGALKKHVRIHTQEKPYECSYCNKAFTQKWNLKTHERQHTGETPYKCKVCGVGYKQNVLLKTHMKTHYDSAIPFSSAPQQQQEQQQQNHHHQQQQQPPQHQLQSLQHPQHPLMSHINVLQNGFPEA